MNKSIRGRYFRWHHLLRVALFTVIPGYFLMVLVIWLGDEPLSRTSALFGSHPFMFWLVLLSALRRGELIVSEVKDTPRLKDLVADKLESAGFRQVDEDTWLPKGKWALRLHQWFGTGTVNIRWAPDGLVLQGPYRIVDEMDARLTFGRVRIS